MNFKENETAQKLRGGYYTPLDLALYLSTWIAEISPASVLEPSCGDGVFLEALASLGLRSTKTTAIEIDQRELSLASQRCIRKSSTNLINADFLEWYLTKGIHSPKFDAIVGNPPFIRYQYLSRKDQLFSEKIFQRHGLRFTRHTNAWVPFVIASLAMLKAGGRIAMVLPSEIAHVLHAQSLRTFISDQCVRVMMIDPEEIWFEHTLQGAILFLAEKKSTPNEKTEGLKIIRTKGKSFLEKRPTEYFKSCDFVNGETTQGKWTRALLSKNELKAFDSATSTPSVHKFSDIASVDVGIVTGANKFFLVDDSTVSRYGLERWSYPMFGRSEHCPGILYNLEQHAANCEAGLPTNFIWFDVSSISELTSNEARYVREGELLNLHTRYKCRIRKPWFKVPSVYSTSVGMLKRSHSIPRLIYNDMGAYTTDTAYRIRASKLPPKKLVYCFINSLTALSAELEGRHYGGGVLELVPSEIERLFIPLPKGVRVSLKSLDKMARQGGPEQLLNIQDQKILTPLGLSSNEIASLHSAWLKLKGRRQRKEIVISR